MSSPRYDWWGYCKGMIRRYPSRNTDKEREAVAAAVEITRALPDGECRIKLVELIFWKKTHTLQGAAGKVGASERTARRWHTEFIRCVAREYGLME